MTTTGIPLIGGNPQDSGHYVSIKPCSPQLSSEEVQKAVVELLENIPGVADRAKNAKRIFVKINLSPLGLALYKDRPYQHVDPDVLDGCLAFLRKHSSADLFVGDGTDGVGPGQAIADYGHGKVMAAYGAELLDLNAPPHARFEVPHPAAFRWFDLSAALASMDMVVSLAKMKSHHLCGVTLSLKNLFGIPPNTVYGSPRGALHSALRLPPVVADLAQLFPPDIALIDGITGANYSEWGGDPVTSGVLIAGNNAVATDAVAARFMGVDPEACRGTPPFIRADNLIGLSSAMGLGPVDMDGIELIGEFPEDRRPFVVTGGSEPGIFTEMEEKRTRVCDEALWYFDRRDQIAEQYAGEFITISGHEVIQHSAGDAKWIDVVQDLLKERRLGFYDPFFKLVREEEDELVELYQENMQ